MLRFACMELMWGGVEGAKFPLWLDEVTVAGFEGIAVRAGTLQPFLDAPETLRGMLRERGLGLAGAYLRFDEAEAKLDTLCGLLRRLDCGDAILHGGRAASERDRLEAAIRIDALGARAASLGVRLSYHHHSESLFETLEETELLLARTDPRHVGLFLDTGHATQDFRGHPVAERAALLLRRHPARGRFVEFKAWTPERGLASELGAGPLDLDAVAAELVRLGHAGWITLEQNAPTPGATPRACAARSLKAARACFERIALGQAPAR
ncbi:MAG: TIM barrel protein [Planctomycetota bacterium]|nr:TIM barrel protein [Planctomycetota bacterium]